MMRLGISLQEGYLIILATLIVLQGAGTIYGLWAQGRAATPEAVRRLAVANSRVRMGWWLIIVFTVAWWWGMASLVVLFAIFSFFLLREFIALTPIRHTDHWVLVVAFYLAIPAQYALVYFNLTHVFTLFIPVYLFLVLPVIAAMSHDTERYLERVAKVQWGLMIYRVPRRPCLGARQFRFGRQGAEDEPEQDRQGPHRRLVSGGDRRHWALLAYARLDSADGALRACHCSLVHHGRHGHQLGQAQSRLQVLGKRVLHRSRHHRTPGAAHICRARVLSSDAHFPKLRSLPQHQLTASSR